MPDNPSYIAGIDSRQCVAAIAVTLTVAQFAARSNVIDLQLPPNSQVIAGGDFVIRTPSNDTGTATISIGDGLSATRYMGATNAKAAADTRTAVTPTGYLSTAAATPGVRITYTPQNANATAGEFTFIIPYVTFGKSEWTEG